MWWSRRGLILGSAAALTACGFRPLYKKDAFDPGVTHELAQIKVLTVTGRNREDDRQEQRRYDRLRQQFNSLLRSRLNPDGASRTVRYQLESDLDVSLARTGIQITEEATRARLTVRVTFRLYDAGTRQILYTGSEQSINSYNVVDSQFATLSAEKDAARRAVREISESLRLRLAIYFQRQQKG
jgi:LPS-assembly lipoprotein